MRSDGSLRDDAPFAWQSLEQRVQDYLLAEGIPMTQASSLSHKIIVICANDAESVDRADLDERAFDEAKTLVETWRASRREQALAGN